MVCKNPKCRESLTTKQIKRWKQKHGKKRFPPQPTCSRACTTELKRAPPKHKRTEEWAQSTSGDGRGGSWGYRG